MFWQLPPSPSLGAAAAVEALAAFFSRCSCSLSLSEKERQFMRVFFGVFQTLLLLFLFLSPSLEEKRNGERG